MSTQDEHANTHKSIDDFKKQAMDGKRIKGGGDLELGAPTDGEIDPLLDLGNDPNANPQLPIEGPGSNPITYKPTQ